MTDIQRDLFAMQEVAYGDFAAKLLPTLPREAVIGVRLPLLHKYAKKIAGTALAAQFMKDLPHTYLEENHLHAYLISQMRDVQACFAHLDAFLPHVDNWSVCDSLRPKILTRDRAALLDKIDAYLQSPHPYTVRFGIELLMVYFLDEHFSPEQAERVAAVQSEEYYVQMMIAWYFATALAKQWDRALPYLEERRLSPWVHRKTVQKAVESYRITAAQKAYLRTLKAVR